jgi:hypothetical protein
MVKMNYQPLEFMQYFLRGDFMRLLLVFTIGLALVLVACTSATISPTTAPAPTPAFTPGTIPTSVATPTSILVTPTTFFLSVTAPQDESVVTTAVIQVTGETAVDAVVTVNGQIAEVDATGLFQATLTLAEGPTTIEVVASDFSGNQGQELRTVIFVR